jgi:transposase
VAFLEVGRGDASLGGVGISFISSDCGEAFALPQDIRDWLPAGHLCWYLLRFVDELDLSGFMAGYRADGQGRSAYHPAAMLALVLYCYSKGTRSSRRIEAACVDDVGCRIITANHRVDHATIARFLRRHRMALKALFAQVLGLCADRGLVDLEAVAIDGSPMDADASKDSNSSLARLEAVVAESAHAIDMLLLDVWRCEQDSERAGGLEPHDVEPANQCPALLARLCDRAVRARSAIEKLYERALPSAGETKIKVDAAERMLARAEQRLATVSADQQARLDDHARRAQQDRASGRRGANGRPPVTLDAKTVIVRQRARLERARAWLERARHPRPTPAETARASRSDPDSRLMLGKQGGYLQGYNLQVACARNQLLLAIELQDNPADMTALVPMVRAVQSNCVAAGITRPVRAWLADSGYASAANFAALAGLPLLVSVANEGQHTGRAEPPDIDTVPIGQREMAARLATPGGAALYKRRGSLVEPGFAQLFQRFGRHLNYRGTASVDAEIKLLGLVHNLAKLILHDTRTAP